MPAWQDTTGQKSPPPTKRLRCPRCKTMNPTDVKTCVNCDWLLRRT